MQSRSIHKTSILGSWALAGAWLVILIGMSMVSDENITLNFENDVELQTAETTLFQPSTQIIDRSEFVDFETQVF